MMETKNMERRKETALAIGLTVLVLLFSCLGTEISRRDVQGCILQRIRVIDGRVTEALDAAAAYYKEYNVEHVETIFDGNFPVQIEVRVCARDDGK
jgi:hypothetical protein